MPIRFENRNNMVNTWEAYANSPIFQNRGVSFIHQYTTPVIRYPTQDELIKFSIATHVWKVGDRFYKLSHTYYGDARFWWVISWFNRTPLEGHLQIGDVVNIPLPLEEALVYFE